MAQDRRDFLKTSGVLLGSAMTGLLTTDSLSAFSPKSKGTGKMKFSFRPYTLELKHKFTIATNSRTTTPVMLTEIQYEGVTGYGEASMPPYLGESHESATAFLQKVDLTQFSNIFDLETILDYVDSIAPGNKAAKASVDIALHDVIGKLLNNSWVNIWGFNPIKTPNTSYTIGIDTPEVVRQKVQEAAEYKILKVKLGRETDHEMIETIRGVTNVPLCVDVNQGWKEKEKALEEVYWLKERGVVFVEQPMDKKDYDSHAWLTEKSPLPIIADEAIQTLPDVLKAKGAYNGINIKLMKSGGMREAHRMVTVARSFGMKVMIGCMTETSCAISAASHLTPMSDWADLDGALLISNDLYKGTDIQDGKVVISTRPGIGIEKI